MTYRVTVTADGAWPDEAMDALFVEGFPAFITADRAVKEHIGRVRELFGHLDITLVAEGPDGGAPVATGWGVPVVWDGDPAALPPTFAGILRAALAAHDEDRAPDTFVICGGVVHPERKGTGTAGALVEALCDLAAVHGLPRVVAPVRPTRKHLYPLIPVEEYAAWTRDDGLPFDPWLRLHVRLGGRVVGLAPQAQTMTGTVAQWQEWTGLALPGSGDHVIPQGMGVLRVDLAADTGTYVEPNIWVRHR